MPDRHLVCPGCHKELEGIFEPGIFQCIPCGTKFWVPPFEAAIRRPIKNPSS